MIRLIVQTDIDATPWTDAKDAPQGMVERIARIPGGMESGASAVAVMIRLADGKCVIGQTSLANLDAAVMAFRGAEKRRADRN